MLHIDTEILVERARDRAKELIAKGGSLSTYAPEGKRVLSAAKAFLTAVERLEGSHERIARSKAYRTVSEAWRILERYGGTLATVAWAGTEEYRVLDIDSLDDLERQGKVLAVWHKHNGQLVSIPTNVEDPR